jgi:hypothetical protein
MGLYFLARWLGLANELPFLGAGTGLFFFEGLLGVVSRGGGEELGERFLS